jgi:hypothetical protein
LQGHQPDYCFRRHFFEKGIFFGLFFPIFADRSCEVTVVTNLAGETEDSPFPSGVQTCQILRTDATVPGGFGELTVEFSAATTRQLITVHCAGVTFT